MSFISKQSSDLQIEGFPKSSEKQTQRYILIPSNRKSFPLILFFSICWVSFRVVVIALTCPLGLASVAALGSQVIAAVKLWLRGWMVMHLLSSTSAFSLCAWWIECSLLTSTSRIQLGDEVCCGKTISFITSKRWANGKSYCNVKDSMSPYVMKVLKVLNMILVGCIQTLLDLSLSCKSATNVAVTATTLSRNGASWTRSQESMTSATDCDSDLKITVVL